MSKSTVPFELKHGAINVDGIETTTLNLRRINIGDLEETENEKTPRKQSIALIARIATIPPQSVLEIDALDFEALQDKVMTDFLGLDGEK